MVEPLPWTLTPASEAAPIPPVPQVPCDPCSLAANGPATVIEGEGSKIIIGGGGVVVLHEAPACPSGRKDDSEKLRFDLVPPLAEELIVDVLTYGAKKYAPDNWRKVPDPKSRYFAAARRHLSSWQRGEKLDPESGKSHLAHAACCLLFLLEVDA